MVHMRLVSQYRITATLSYLTDPNELLGVINNFDAICSCFLFRLNRRDPHQSNVNDYKV